ncbi:integrase core domain-containing protein [Noviherbaspirillum aerium]|uniref:integrase core domain-containing protein n=1 Tax=Noviherbaspirillum aerium TaxID=2588497 RepID=UPI0021F421E6|nr:integrase core domain-containing protein [Noviherbaspirillum aerium]
MVDRVIRIVKEEQCVHRHRFETPQHASKVIGDWINFHNTRPPHQALGVKDLLRRLLWQPDLNRIRCANT